VEGAFAVRERVRVRILVDDGVFTTGADDELVRGNLLRAGAYEVHAVSL
jgi:predicted amidophosphoribosyltransferase